jgi:3-deoxy-D-manno-octulosonate 8-phosphate phosphatase (KDO 8-P phosphatase)
MDALISRLSAQTLANARAVRLMIFDVDGVLTDGGLYYGPDGEVFKRFNALDGHGIKMLHQFGIQTAIITARKSGILQTRASDLGISYVYQGAHDKRSAFADLLTQSNVTAQACGYLGDDIIDLPVLVRVGFTACVGNAHAEVKTRVQYQTHAQGGNGAAREVCDLLLQAQGHFDTAIAAYLS